MIMVLIQTMLLILFCSFHSSVHRGNHAKCRKLTNQIVSEKFNM